MFPSLLLLFACGSPAPAEPPEPVAETKAGMPPASTDIHAHMEEHFVALTSARNAVISGDLDTARERFGWLATHKTTDELPAAWTVFVDAMREAASQAAKADDVEGLARGVAYVASECGSCHDSMGTGPLYATETSASEGGKVVAHMIRHNEASEQMWQGLISGDDKRWLSGASALADQEPLRELRHPTNDGAPDAALALGEKVHELGQEGLSKMNRVDRAHLYGQLISTCAQCHALANVAAPE